MPRAFSDWSGRHILMAWGIGLVVEAMLVLAMFVLLVDPEPPLVARLNGETAAGTGPSLTIISSDGPATTVRPGTSVPVVPEAPEDSFFTVLHWPLHKPLLEGGGRVIAMPMRMLWVPIAYVGAVPFALLGLTGVWLIVRRRGA